MSSVGSVRKRPFASEAKKFIEEFTDLKYDGAKIICVVCEIPLMCWTKADCRKHINSARHKCKKSGETPRADFLFDLVFMFMACNLPFKLFDNEAFRYFWTKYVPTMKLPSSRTARRFIPSARKKIECAISSELRNKKIWLCIDETTDCQKHSILNVIVRTLDSLKPSSSLLLASKRIQKCTADVITQVVLDTLAHFEIASNQLLMFVTDGAATMLAVGNRLKQQYGNFLHITCKIHMLHLVAEEIRKCYPDVNTLISSTKAVFVKSPQRIREFHRLCPNIPEPPQPIITRWATWLQAAFYYRDHFQQVKSVVLQFDPKEAACIKESQASFQDPQVEKDLHTIHDKYEGLVEAIQQLQNPYLSLLDSLQIVDTVHTQLQGVRDINNSVIVKFDTVLNKNLDFNRLKQLCTISASGGPLQQYKELFTYANITSLDVERSFSAYKNIFSPRRTTFAESTVETYLMLQMVYHSELAVNV